jgi:endonuclease YncB( thermonuclease family)
MSRSWRGPYRAAVSRRRRSLPRRLFDWFLAIAILGLLILLSARLDRSEPRLASGSAIVNDGDTITVGAERIWLRGIDAPEYQQICRKNGADYACGRASREALARLTRNRGFVLGPSARPLRQASRRLQSRRRQSQQRPGRGRMGHRLR